MRAAVVLLGVVMGGAGPEPRPARLPVHVPSLTGVVGASRAVDLLPQEEGRLERLQVRLGERVEAGQVVALLDDRTRRLELAARQAQLAAAEVERTRCTLLLRQARQQLVREQRLRDYSAAEQVEKAEHAVALAATDVELARARASAVRAEVALAQEHLARAEVRAPFAGTVSEEYLQPGMMANGTTPILRLVGEERMLRLAIPEALAGLLRQGDPLRVRLGDTLLVPGTLERLSPELDAVSRHLKAEARLELPPEARALLPVGLVVPVELGEAPPPSPGAP